MIGSEDGNGYCSLVGSEIGAGYLQPLPLERLEGAQVASVLVDLKRRSAGDPHVISPDDETIVLGQRACPCSAAPRCA